MTQQQYFQLAIRIKPDDKAEMDKLREKGFTVVAILRAGIEALRKERK